MKNSGYILLEILGALVVSLLFVQGIFSVETLLLNTRATTLEKREKLKNLSNWQYSDLQKCMKVKWQNSIILNCEKKLTSGETQTRSFVYEE